VNFTALLYIGGRTLLGLPSLARASRAATVSIELAQGSQNRSLAFALEILRMADCAKL